MEIVAVAGLAQNFGALRSLITSNPKPHENALAQHSQSTGCNNRSEEKSHEFLMAVRLLTVQ